MTKAEILEAFWRAMLANTKMTFWKRLQSAFEWAYDESFQSVLNDPRVLEDQRPAKLLDERFYVAESAMQRSAKETGLISSGKKVTINNWYYTLVRGGDVSMVQSYVQSPSELARPAKFRETLSAVNTFLSAPQFDLGDIDPLVFSVAKLNGIVIHGPIGKKFDGFLNFAVADESYSAWSINVSVAEIIAHFENSELGAEMPQRDIATPRIKRVTKKKDD